MVKQSELPPVLNSEEKQENLLLADTLIKLITKFLFYADTENTPVTVRLETWNGLLAALSSELQAASTEIGKHGKTKCLMRIIPIIIKMSHFCDFNDFCPEINEDDENENPLKSLIGINTIKAITSMAVRPNVDPSETPEDFNAPKVEKSRSQDLRKLLEG